MPRSTRPARAALALALATWSQACQTYRAASADHELSDRQRIRVSAQTPFALSAPSELAPWTPCMVTSVDGDVRRIVGDTILLACVGGVVPAARPDGTGASCPTHSAVTFVRTPATDLAVRRSDPGRTTLLLVGIATAFVGFAAYAASHIEMPLP